MGGARTPQNIVSVDSLNPTELARLTHTFFFIQFTTCNRDAYSALIVGGPPIETDKCLRTSSPACCIPSTNVMGGARICSYSRPTPASIWFLTPPRALKKQPLTRRNGEGVSALIVGGARIRADMRLRSKQQRRMMNAELSNGICLACP